MMKGFMQETLKGVSDYEQHLVMVLCPTDRQLSAALHELAAYLIQLLKQQTLPAE